MSPFLRRAGIILLAAGFLTSCAASPTAKVAPSLGKMLKNKEIVSIPYSFYGKGVFMVELSVNQQQNMRFLIDTGATQSAVYRSTLETLGLETEAGTSIKVHGMNQSGDRPLVVLPSLSVGERRLDDVKMAVLDNRQDPEHTGPMPAGLIGMDLLSQYRIYVDADSQTFNLIPRSLPAPHIPWQWKTVELMSNPFLEDTRDLHFLKIRLGNHQLPALLDSGSEENLMSWSVSKYPQLRFAKKRLYDRWLIEGAVGTFDPEYVVRAKNLRSGGKYWDETRFIVMEFDGLEILGVADQPFLIAGSPLLARETFYLDFAENVIRFKPPRSKPGSYMIKRSDAAFRDEG